jgi:trk/ktr system potassium uptake protein
MLVAGVVSVLYREWPQAAQIAAASGITVAIGLALWKGFDRPGDLTTREAFASVGLAWAAACMVGILPYLFTGSITDVTNAFFESVSGFTTTGATVIADPARLSHGVLFWRSLTQWIGAMGILALSVAILPLLGMGAVRLTRADSPGRLPDRLAPRFRETARRMWLVYGAFTLAEVLLLWPGDMSLFESANHALTTLSTGGFSTSADSLGAFSAYSQWIVIVFMVIAGTAFTLHYRARRDPRVYARSTEFRLYVGIMAVAAVVLLVGTWGDGGGVLRHAIFTSVSMVTTTGYATVDFAAWSTGLGIVIVGLMFVGGMAASTAGSLKVYRLGVLTEASVADVRRLIHPRGVFVTRLGKDPVPDTIVEAVQTFFLLYMFAFSAGAFALAVIGSIAEPQLDLVTTVSAVAASLGNIGPGLSQVGPGETYGIVPAIGKWLLATLMIVGRLEILPIVILFNRDLWRR